jgi:hypothetical protein
LGDWGTRGLGDEGTGRRGDWETRGLGDEGTVKASVSPIHYSLFTIPYSL